VLAQPGYGTRISSRTAPARGAAGAHRCRPTGRARAALPDLLRSGIAPSSSPSRGRWMAARRAVARDRVDGAPRPRRGSATCPSLRPGPRPRPRSTPIDRRGTEDFSWRSSRSRYAEPRGAVGQHWNSKESEGGGVGSRVASLGRLL
jgi:hypothetical protein